MMPHIFICFDSMIDHDWLGDSDWFGDPRLGFILQDQGVTSLVKSPCLQHWEEQHDELLVWERKSNQHHLIVPCTLEGIVSEAMIDSGATGYSFVDDRI